MKSIANHQARVYVQNLSEFKGSNIFGNWVTGKDNKLRYVVFSYGKHWPMYVWCPVVNRWFSNASWYSRTTHKHHGQAHPLVDTTPLHVDDMIKVADAGITAIIEGAEA